MAGIRGQSSLFWSGSGMLQGKGLQAVTCWISTKISPIQSLPWVHHCYKEKKKGRKEKLRFPAPELLTHE